MLALDLIFFKSKKSKGRKNTFSIVVEYHNNIKFFWFNKFLGVTTTYKMLLYSPL